MHILGICNPSGEENSYNGLYLTKSELQHICDSGDFKNVPVLTEHGGASCGTVVSAFLDNLGRLNAVMEIDETQAIGAIAAGFVRDGINQELSLGYSVDVTHSTENGLNQKTAGTKQIMEVSLVTQGARDRCYVLAYEDANSTQTKFIERKEETHSPVKSLVANTDSLQNAAESKDLKDWEVFGIL